MQSTPSVNAHRNTDKDICRFHVPACQSYTEFFSLQEDDIIERRIPQQHNKHTQHCNEFIMPGIHFMHFEYSDSQAGEVAFKSTEPYVSLVFAIKTKCTYINDSNVIFAEVNHNEHQLLFISNRVTHLRWQSEQAGQILIINLTVEYFKRFLTATHPVHTAFESSLYQNIHSVLLEQSLTITPRMISLLYEITQSNYKKEYKRLLIKSKVIELLMLQFEQAEQVLVQLEGNHLPKNVNVQKMYLAREIITSNLSQSCSILDLAQQIGTNDCYLKKHFKQVFGTTVYGYLQKERMEKSRELLLEGDRKISEVARLAGYKHASHFTTAFKKYFGYLPNKIKLAFISFFCEPEVIVLLETPNILLAA